MEYKLSAADFGRIRQLRHDLHRHPELSGEEYRTTECLRDFLSALPGCRSTHR